MLLHDQQALVSLKLDPPQTKLALNRALGHIKAKRQHADVCSLDLRAQLEGIKYSLNLEEVFMYEVEVEVLSSM